MDHSHFKANQTAAVYVANGLDPRTQEAFELHMMSCPDCLNDVEMWRAIRNHMPTAVEERMPAPAARRRFSMQGLRMAAAIALATFAGSLGGWFVRSAQDPHIDAAQTFFFNLPPATRAAECTQLQLAPQTRVLVVRVPGVASDHRVVAVDSNGTELRSGAYDIQRQPDGSWVVRLDSTLVERRTVHFETVGPDGSSTQAGCITGTPALIL